VTPELSTYVTSREGLYLVSATRLEEERDALPGLITALGFEPLRFEDFTASRGRAGGLCPRGRRGGRLSALIGPTYGERMPDTGLAPTHEEYNAARAKGIPVLVIS